jgi:hypothetical protein
MPKVYELEGLGQFEFPDDASDKEIQSWVDDYASKKAGIIESVRRFPKDVAASALSSTSSMLALADPEPKEVGQGWAFEKEARRREGEKAAAQGGFLPGRGSGPSFGGTSALFGQDMLGRGGPRGFDLPDPARESLKSEVEASREASRIGAAGEDVAQEIKDSAYGYSKPFIRDTLSSIGSVVPTGLIGILSPPAAIAAAGAQSAGGKYLENKKRYEHAGLIRWKRTKWPVRTPLLQAQLLEPSRLALAGCLAAASNVS